MLDQELVYSKVYRQIYTSQVCFEFYMMRTRSIYDFTCLPFLYLAFLLPGEMSHHEVLDAVHRGTHVILTRHSNSERGFLEVAAKSHLKCLMPEVLLESTLKNYFSALIMLLNGCYLSYF